MDSKSFFQERAKQPPSSSYFKNLFFGLNNKIINTLRQQSYCPLRLQNKGLFFKFLNKNMVFSKSRGLINDSISDMLTRIRNVSLAQKSNVNIPFTKLNLELAKILEKEGFIQSFHLAPERRAFELQTGDTDFERYSGLTQSQDLNLNDIVIRLKYSSKKLYKGKTKESCITNLRRISKPGLRIYANYREIPRILNGTGIAIISTPCGIMTDREARARKLGGELLCSIW